MMETVTYSIKLFSNVGKFKVLWTCSKREVKEKIKSEIKREFPDFTLEGSYVQIIQFRNREPNETKNKIEQIIVKTAKKNGFKVKKKF